MRLRVQSLASSSRLRIRRCRELWYRSQTWLGFGCCGSGVGRQQRLLLRPLAWDPPYARVWPKKDQKKKRLAFKDFLEEGNLDLPFWPLFSLLLFILAQIFNLEYISSHRSPYHKIQLNMISIEFFVHFNLK